MKIVRIFLIVAVIVVAFGYRGVKAGKEAIAEGIMTMTTSIDSVGICLSGVGNVTIDWGDGSEPEIYALLEDFTEIGRKFSDETSRTITIIGRNITFLSCGANQLTALDVSQNTSLTELRAPINQLTELNLSKNTALTELVVDFNRLSALDVSQNTALMRLSCSSNLFTELDLSQNTALTHLRCEHGLSVALTKLDVSKNTALKELICYYHELTELDVSQNTALKVLDCRYNELTYLDLSQNTELEELLCDNNQLTAEALNALFTTLHDNNFRKIIYIDNNPGAANCDPSIAERKGWIVER